MLLIVRYDCYVSGKLTGGVDYQVRHYDVPAGADMLALVREEPVVSYLNGKEIGRSSITIWTKKKKQYTLTPDVYSFSFEVENALNQFIEQENKEKKCNQLQITIFTKKKYAIRTFWDEESHLLDLRLIDSAKEDEKNLLSTNLLEIPIDTFRFIKSKFNNETERVLSLPINDKIHCEFYVRLNSLLGEPNQTNFEGFSYYIYDKEKNIHFSACLTGFGAGYFAKIDSKETKKIISDFHQNLYSNKLVLKECILEFEHDFGKSTFGFKNGKYICDTTTFE